MGVVSENGIPTPMGLHQTKVSISGNALQRAGRKTHQVKCPINYTVKKFGSRV
jgi:hypothetical protein